MTDRRGFIQGGLGATGAMIVAGTCPARAAELVSQPGFRLFEVTTSVDLAEKQKAAQLWLPMFQSVADQQRAVATNWEAAHASVRIDHDPVFGAPVLHARWREGERPRQLKLVQRVAVRDRSPADKGVHATSKEQKFWSTSATLAPGPLARKQASEIVGELREPQAKARAIYDWVVAKTWRDSSIAGCGTGDVEAMLRKQSFGGKCVDINGLMVSLCRAAGLPAREVYGLRLAESKRFKSLGRKGDVTSAQHCRAEVYVDGSGWLAVDPADVRKAVLEEKLPVDSPQIKQLADTLFGSSEANWAGYNSATGIKLARAPLPPNYNFLMYACTMTSDSVAACLDAANFTYQIRSTEITA